MQIDIADPVSVGQRKTTSAWDGNVGMLSAPIGSTPVGASSGNQSNSAALSTLPAVAGVTNYMTGFVINVGGATAQALVNATITGLLGGTMNIAVSVPAGATLANPPIVVTFPVPIPASGPNVAIALNLPQLGGGSTNASTSIYGFQK
jgi:hypothetical protein